MKNPATKKLTRKALMAAVLAAAPLVASSKGSSPADEWPSPGGVVPIALAQRVMHFDSDRIWSDTEGLVLVCPLKQASCKKSEQDRWKWTPVTALQVRGFEVAAVQNFFFSSGSTVYHQLLVFFAKKEQPK